MTAYIVFFLGSWNLLGILPQEPSAEVTPEAAALFRDVVEPTFRKWCLDCHSRPRPKAGLDLSDRQGLLRGGMGGPAVDWEDPSSSLLLRVVKHEAEPFMPLRGAALEDNTITALEKWLIGGAPYFARASDAGAENSGTAPEGELQVTARDRNFWSFRKISQPNLPEVPDGEDLGPVDRFVAMKLRDKGLNFAPPLAKDRLIRRLSFGLLGLPPEWRQVNEFVTCEEEDAWEALVDSYLQNPHFGERWARHWLDLARYADSGGYEFDIERPNAWPYRDFVVDAINADLPYDQFVQWQIAGDEYAPGDPQALAATGFLTAGPTISNQQSEKNRYDEMDDMLATTGSAVLGLTIGCARCHDHKYDPIPTRDYYGLLGAFMNTHRREAPWARQEEIQERRRQAKELERALHLARRRADQWSRPWRDMERQRRLSELEITPAERELLQATRDPQWRYWSYTFSPPENGWEKEEFEATSWPVGPGGFGNIRNENTSLNTLWRNHRIWLRREFVWQEEPENFALSIYYVDEADIYINGVLAAELTDSVTDYLSVPIRPEARASLRNGTNLLAIACRKTGKEQYIDALPHPKDLLKRTSSRDLAILTDYRKVQQQYKERLMVTDEQVFASLPESERTEWELLRSAIEEMESRELEELPKVLCAMDQTGPAIPAYLLERGDPSSKKEVVSFGFLQVLSPEKPPVDYFAPVPPSQVGSTGRRRALANWLTDAEQGAGALTARVIVNRLWQHHFGQGLVRTPSDFGLQGDRPSHPELLEWLAAELIRSNWRLKPIHKLILMSRTYRQGASSSESHVADVEGRWISGRRLQRLEAEALRDAILSISGSLNPRLGGPSVKPWMHPDAIATGSTAKWPQDVIDGPETWRRSLYVFIRRSALFPLFETFDATDATSSCSRRVNTVTAPQALALLNHPFIREQSRLFAKRVLREAERSPAAQLTYAFRLAFGRSPSPAEHQEGAQFLKQQQIRYAHEDDPNLHAWIDLCQVLFNLNEFLYVD